MSWRTSLLDVAVNDHNSFEKEELVNYDVYQFGVFNGGSMKEIASILNRHKIEVNNFYGFDVFTGMPKETAEPIFQDSWNPDIFPDEFTHPEYVQFFNFGKKSANAIKKIKLSFYNSGVAVDSLVSNFASYRMSKDNYVLDVIMI